MGAAGSSLTPPGHLPVLFSRSTFQNKVEFLNVRPIAEVAQGVPVYPTASVPYG